MAFTENIIEHGKYADGTFSYYAEIICDTAADIPDPAAHPNWEVGSKLLVLENGGSQYRLSNARNWVQVNFNTGGEGGDAGIALLHTKNIKVYVNSATGSDTNDGLKASTAFATLAHAVNVTAAYGTTEIVLAEGEYDYDEAGVIYAYNRDLRISGAGSDSTTLYAKVYANSSNVELVKLTLDTSRTTNTTSAPLTSIHGSTCLMTDCVISTNATNGVYVGNMGYAYIANTVINGTTERMVYVTNDGSATILNTSGTTESTRPNVLSGASAMVRIIGCPDLTYSTNYTGIVFVDGIQKSPLANEASSTNGILLPEDETLESDVVLPSVETTETVALTPTDTKTTDTELM